MKKRTRSAAEPETSEKEEVLPVFCVESADVPVEPNGNPLDAGAKIAGLLRPFPYDHGSDRKK